MKPTTETDNPLWEFACQHWQHAPLQALLLELQTRHACRINLVFLACWAASKGQNIASSMAGIVTESAVWHAQMIRPIRSLRSLASEKPKHEALKKRLLEAELLAEKSELQDLYELYQRDVAGREASVSKLEDPKILCFDNLKALFEAEQMPVKQDTIVQICQLTLSCTDTF